MNKSKRVNNIIDGVRDNDEIELVVRSNLVKKSEDRCFIPVSFLWL